MTNLFQQETLVSLEDRSRIKNQKPLVLWFTGLSGSGKSTIASSLNLLLAQNGFSSYMLDGDNIRLGINSDLDFSEEGRKENIRRIAEIAKLFADASEIVLCSFVSPFEEDRKQAKQVIGEDLFIEIFVNCPLEECEKRDVKGLYKMARTGEIPNFTGISSPYEEPKNPTIEIKTDKLSIDQSVQEIYTTIKDKIRLA